MGKIITLAPSSLAQPQEATNRRWAKPRSANAHCNYADRRAVQQNELSIPVDAEPRDVQVDPGLCVPLMQATFEKL